MYRDTERERVKEREKREVLGQGERRGVTSPRESLLLPLASPALLSPPCGPPLFAQPSGTHWVLRTHMHGGAGQCFLAASIGPGHGKLAGLRCPGCLLGEEFRGTGHAKKNGRAVPQFV